MTAEALGLQMRRAIALALLTLLVTALLPIGGARAAANPIETENQQPGTNAWRLTSAVADDTTRQIKGFASSTSVAQGQNITLYVTVNPVQTYTIDFYRIGWYGGLGGRLRLHAGPLNGSKQNNCSANSSTGLLACNWNPSYTLTVPTDWTSGIYLGLLTNAAGYQNYVMFVVRDGRPAPLLYQQAVNTYQAYNNFPDDAHTGKSLYTFNSYGPKTVSGDARAVKVSFDRPYSYDGSGQFLNWEVDFVRWIERAGFDVTYSTDVDTHANGAGLRSRKGVLAVGHSEYWSKEMYDAAEGARDAGVGLGFFGANEVYWQVRFEASAGGTANRVLVCYKDASLDPVQGPTKTVKWHDPVLNRPEQSLVGVQFTSEVDWGMNTSYVVTNSSHWVYAGTGFRDGDSVPGILGYEMDRAWTDYPAPPGTNYTTLSRSPFTDFVGVSDYANSSIYQAPSGAWVFGAGTISWSWGLDNFDHQYADARIQRTTYNVLNAFLYGAPQSLQITSPQATGIGTTLATITWSTNNPADSKVEYGPTTSYGSVATDTAQVTSHSVPLSGLTAGTTYHYRVSSADGSGQSATSPDVTFTTTSDAPPLNLVANPGFEAGGASWTLAPQAAIDPTPVNAHSGSSSLQLTATAGYQGTWQAVPVTPGQTYILSGWQRSAVNGGDLAIQAYDASWMALDAGMHQSFTGDGTWKFVSGTYATPARAAWVLVGLQSSAPGVFWFDDIRLVPNGPPPPPPATVDHLRVAVPAGAIAGQAFNVDVTAEDAQGGVVSGYTGTVHFASSDATTGVVLPADSTLTNGHGVFSATLVRAGAQTITGSDAANALSTTANIAITAAPASRLVLGTATATPTAGTSFSFTVAAQDQFANVDTAYAGNVHFTSTDTSAGVVLPADATLTSGQGTFAATLTRAGAQTVTGRDASNQSIAGTVAVTVRPAAAASLTLDAPSSVAAGQSFNATVTLRDQFGNVATGYRGTVHFTTSDVPLLARVPDDYTFTAADAGTRAFSFTLVTPPSQTITAADTANAALRATSGAITVRLL